MLTTRCSPASSRSMRRSSASEGKGADVGQVEAVAEPLGAALHHRPDPEDDAAGAVGKAERDVAVGEADGGGGGDRVAQQHRVGEAVDADLLARGEGAEDAGEDRLHQLRRTDPHLGRRRRRGQLAPRRLDRVFLVAAQPQVHADRGAAVAAAADLEAGGEGGDQGEADPQARPVDVGARPDPHPAIADLDRQALVLGEGVDFERPLAVLGVGMDDDVHRRLGDDRLQVGERGLVHPQLLAEAGESMPNHGDVLRPGRQRHPQPRSIIRGRVQDSNPVIRGSPSPFCPEASISIGRLTIRLPPRISGKPETPRRDVR